MMKLNEVQDFILPVASTKSLAGALAGASLCTLDLTTRDGVIHRVCVYVISLDRTAPQPGEDEPDTIVQLRVTGHPVTICPTCGRESR